MNGFDSIWNPKKITYKSTKSEKWDREEDDWNKNQKQWTNGLYSWTNAHVKNKFNNNSTKFAHCILWCNMVRLWILIFIQHLAQKTIGHTICKVVRLRRFTSHLYFWPFYFQHSTKAFIRSRFSVEHKNKNEIYIIHRVCYVGGKLGL